MTRKSLSAWLVVLALTVTACGGGGGSGGQSGGKTTLAYALWNKDQRR